MEMARLTNVVLLSRKFLIGPVKTILGEGTNTPPKEFEFASRKET